MVLATRRTWVWATLALATVFCAADPSDNPPLQGRNYTYVAGVFRCRGDFPLFEVEAVLDRLQELEAELTQRLGLPACRDEIQVCLFRNRAGYARFLAQSLPGAPYRRALFLANGRSATVLAQLGPEFERDLRHECTHALLHASIPAIPLWLDEALAAYFEICPEQRPRGYPFLDAICAAAAQDLVPQLEAIERQTDFCRLGEEHYQAAWAWADFLLEGPSDARLELTSYLAALRSGAQTEPLSRRLRRHVPQLLPRFAEHFRTWKR